MEKRIPIIAALLLFLASGALLSNRTVRYFQPFSQQATINPATIKEEFNPSENVAIFNNRGVFVPSSVDSIIASDLPQTNVLSATTEKKRIEVDLTNQRLYAYEGDRKVYDFLVSTGKWGKTPTGVYKIWIKLRSAKMEGGSEKLGTYYYLPNVPYVMYFSNDKIPKWRGYGIHGTYWHDNFGTPMSHGCINMNTEQARELYYWAEDVNPQNLGTTVVIYGVAPNK